MAVKVVDASALGSLLFGEPDSEAVAVRLRQHRLAAPALLEFELANICVKKIRRHPKLRDTLLSAFGLYGQLQIEIVRVDLAGTLAMADGSGLSAYDASYLWLARALDAELVTLDKKLEAVNARLPRA